MKITILGRMITIEKKEPIEKGGETGGLQDGHTLQSEIQEFSVDFYCKNCQKKFRLSFPVGSKIERAPYLGGA